MSVASLQFLAALLLLSAVVFYLPGPHWRQLVLAICNAGFLYLWIPTTADWAALGIFLLSGYAAARLLKVWPSRTLLTVYLVLLVAAFVLIRKYELVTLLLPGSIAANTLRVVGLSYMLFRQIHFLVDTVQGQVARVSLWDYANYQLSLFTLLSGPIQRFQDFQKQWMVLSPALKDVHDLRWAYFRLLIGVIKITVLATIFMSLYEKSSAILMQDGASLPGRGTAIGSFFGVLYFYPIYLYLNFSGYCDIVIAGSSLVGVIVPENFNHPYLSRNAIDFWTRWHRTLGFWIRDYVFLPLYKGIAEKSPVQAESLAFLCYFVAFFIVGVWHGPTLNFIAFGLFQGIGVSAAKLWESHLLKRRGRTGLKLYLQSPRVRAIAIIGTLHFEFFSMLFFPTDLHTTVRMLQTALTAIV